MTYLLDTNTCVHILRKKGSPLVKARYAAQLPQDVALCSVVIGELGYGAERSSNPAQEQARIDAFAAPLVCLPYDEPAARGVSAHVRFVLESRGTPIGLYDLQIAAIGLVHDLTVVTHNTAEFGRVPGLKIEDWEI
jgi:tRNA(fMet)-specific endonuclease VapC